MLRYMDKIFIFDQIKKQNIRKFHKNVRILKISLRINKSVVLNFSASGGVRTCEGKGEKKMAHSPKFKFFTGQSGN